MKRVVWKGDSKTRIRRFPAPVRKEAGRQLLRIQHGLDPTDWKPLPTIGPGVREIRIRERGQYRILYVLVQGDTVVVLHAFEKKTRRTPQRAVVLARKRLREPTVPQEPPNGEGQS